MTSLKLQAIWSVHLRWKALYETQRWWKLAGILEKPEPSIGELVKAFVVLKEGFEPTDEIRELIGFGKKNDGTSSGTQRDFLYESSSLNQKWEKSWEDCSKLVNWDYQKERFVNTWKKG